MNKTLLLVLVSVIIGASIKPIYERLFPNPPPPPVLVENSVLVEAVKADAFLISAVAPASGNLTLKSSSDQSSDAPGNGLLDMIGQAWTNARTRDQITISVKGTAEAGFDLNQISDKSVIQNDERGVIFNLGTPQVRHIYIDHSSVNTLKTSVGSLNFSEDPNLAFEALSKAEAVIRTEACQKNILGTAGPTGTKIVATLINAMRARGDMRPVKVLYDPGKC